MNDAKDRDPSMPQCAYCGVPANERYCRVPKGRGPADCPSLRYKKMAENARCDTPMEEMEFMRQSAIQESFGYADRDKGYARVRPAKPRIVEIVEFAKRMKYQKLGLIFCGGVHKEARIVQEILETNGFTVVSVVCKAGKAAKSDYGVTQEQHVDATKDCETICNPKFQALIVNEADVDFTILLGLCVGHDSMAVKHATSPVTVLAVKDRLTGHSPLMPIYLYDSYYRYLKHPLPLEDE